ncbi:MAG: alpha/beta hydrolase-fold protein [Luteolibacter sp.]|uniref:alpha/beta hydrolase-fold protein n=1 Tax=Luteolibacter sp. TaxID=1962973 RepID=UPI0032631BEA
MFSRFLPALISVLMLTAAQGAEPPESPQILKDNRVTFRFEDPTAETVMLKGIRRTLVEMKRNKKGIWSVTVGPMDPGIYDYSFMVDGDQVIDPSNAAVKPEVNPDTSTLEITTNTPLFYQWRDVPHGTIHLHEYYSQSLKRLRHVRVYTPPGYDQETERHYPVLYLFHGTGDTEATWTEFGHAHLIMDNLIADGKALPMLIVMPDGHADLQEEEGDHKANFVKFEADVLGSVVPLVDSSYRTIATSAGRAINGLSMGGMQSLEIGINHPDMFAWIGGMSAYVPDPTDLISKGLGNKQLNDEIKLLWISIGKDDFLLKDAEKFHALLEKHGIRSQWTLTEGTHEWSVWRSYLRDFAPLLFRAKD